MSSQVSFEKLLKPLRALTHWSILAVFFLLPLVFAPFTTEALEMNKQLVMVVLVLLATTGLLGSMVIERRINLRGGWLLNLLPILMLIALLMSASLSVAGLESWLGYGGQEYVSFLTAACGVSLFYTLMQSGDSGLARRSLLALMISAGVIGLFSLFSIIGVHFIPFAFTQTIGFNSIGNINAFVAWLIPVCVVGLGFVLVDSDDESSLIPVGTSGIFTRLLIGFVCFVTVLLLVAIDFWTLWAAFMFGLAALMFLAYLEASHFPSLRRFTLPIVLFAIASIFLLIKTPLNLKVPVVVSPSTNASWDIANQTVQQNLQSLLFGSGPGSFDLDYAHFRPVAVNNTIFWNTPFDRAQMHPLTLLATNGVLGLASWLGLLVVVTAISFGRIIAGRQQPAWRLNYALLAGWVSLLAVQLLTPLNMSLVILVWGLSGLLVAQSVRQVRQLDFSQAPRTALCVTSGLVVFVVVGLLTMFALASRHSAEIAFAKAARLSSQGATAEILVDQMIKVVQRDGSNAVFMRNLATAYLAQAGVVLNEALADQDFGTADKQRLASLADASIRAARQATALGEFDSVNWAISGSIYRELMPFIQNAQNYAANMYVQALVIEPNNPAYQTDLGRVYLAVADRAEDLQGLADVETEIKATAATNEIENLRLAAENFEKAIQLKPDYAPAHYYLAATYERQGNLEGAAERLQALTQVQPNDVGLGFQLAIIYLKMERSTEAEAELERILEIYPDYSNAMWYLAALHSQAGDTETALTLLKRVARLNPDDQVVKDAIANLEAGGEAPADPGPIAPEVPLEGVEPPSSLPSL